MFKAIQLFTFVFFAILADARTFCPIDIVTAMGERDAISLNIRNMGKLPIRRIEFNCSLIHASAHKSKAGLCVERNALFFPAMPYTVRYPYPDSAPQPTLLSLKSVTLSDGFIWKPTRNEPCQTLRIYPQKPRSNSENQKRKR